jgi:hypothetical protein
LLYFAAPPAPRPPPPAPPFFKNLASALFKPQSDFFFVAFRSCFWVCLVGFFEFFSFSNILNTFSLDYLLVLDATFLYSIVLRRARVYKVYRRKKLQKLCLFLQKLCLFLQKLCLFLYLYSSCIWLSVILCIFENLKP